MAGGVDKLENSTTLSETHAPAPPSSYSNFPGIFCFLEYSNSYIWKFVVFIGGRWARYYYMSCFAFQEALEWAMKNHLWGHALFLASKMDPRTYNWVMSG